MCRDSSLSWLASWGSGVRGDKTALISFLWEYLGQCEVRGAVPTTPPLHPCSGSAETGVGGLAFIPTPQGEHNTPTLLPTPHPSTTAVPAAGGMREPPALLNSLLRGRTKFRLLFRLLFVFLRAPASACHRGTVHVSGGWELFASPQCPSTTGRAETAQGSARVLCTELRHRVESLE